MTFVFAGMGQSSHDWPVHLMHLTEATFLAVAFVCLILVMVWKRFATSGHLSAELSRAAIALVGGLSSSFGLIMPLELAPFFFGSKGEVMLGSILLNLAYLPVALLFGVIFADLMRPIHKDRYALDEAPPADHS